MIRNIKQLKHTILPRWKKRTFDYNNANMAYAEIIMLQQELEFYLLTNYPQRENI